MFLITGLVGFVLVLTADARLVSSSESPYPCTETKECLLYDLVCVNSDAYEVRHYSSLKWVSTVDSGYLMEAPTIRSFRRLFAYIGGANEQGVRVEMTSPVIIKVSGDYTMSFLLPSEHQANPPTPTDEQVFISDMPDMKVYVRSYGGWMSSFSDWLQGYYLRGDLDRAGAQYSSALHYAVGYDSPMKFLDRHNEVWYVVEGEHVC